MQKLMTLTLTQDEAFEMLAQHLTEMVLNDRDNLYDHITSGKMLKLVPNMAAMTPRMIAEQIGELNLAESLGIQHDVDSVFVSLDNNYDDFYLVWDRRNMDVFSEEVQPSHVILNNKYMKVGRILKDNSGSNESFESHLVRWNNHQYEVFCQNKWQRLEFPISCFLVEWKKEGNYK